MSILGIVIVDKDIDTNGGLHEKQIPVPDAYIVDTSLRLYRITNSTINARTVLYLSADASARVRLGIVSCTRQSAQWELRPEEDPQYTVWKTNTSR